MSIDDRLDALEREMRRLTDITEITQLIARYGPLVDAGCAEAVAALWTDDGVYDVDEIRMDHAAAIADMVRSAKHQGFIAQGCAHFNGPVAVTVDGDTATAVGHSLMVMNDDEFRFSIRRATAHRWSLVRTAAGWRVTNRTSRVLDGRDEAPGLFADGLAAERFRG